MSYILEDLSFGYGGITLIVDEANSAFSMTDFSTEAEIEAALQTFTIFTRLTKETQMVSYFLYFDLVIKFMYICIYVYLKTVCGYIITDECHPHLQRAYISISKKNWASTSKT